MKPTCTILSAAVIVMALFPAARASAEEPLKVGLVAEFSGPFAGYGKQIHNGIKAEASARPSPVSAPSSAAAHAPPMASGR
jgi:hypothetical protein